MSPPGQCAQGTEWRDLTSKDCAARSEKGRIQTEPGKRGTLEAAVRSTRGKPAPRPWKGGREPAEGKLFGDLEIEKNALSLGGICGIGAGEWALFPTRSVARLTAAGESRKKRARWGRKKKNRVSTDRNGKKTVKKRRGKEEPASIPCGSGSKRQQAWVP